MTVMTSWDLFDDLRSARYDLMQQSGVPGLWAGQFGRQPDAASASQAWAPAVDITEGTDAYLVAVELPGIGTEDVEIAYQDGLLTIQGARHHATEVAGEKVHRAERRYGSFRRSITLPSHVQADKIEASAQDGVLLIVVPKAQEAHARRIQVTVGSAKPAVSGAAEQSSA
jgi:HSP20 family protein